MSDDDVHKDLLRLPFHSATYFGPSRNEWWNADFVALLARRLQLGQARSVLDVGTGAGHWLLTLAPHLASDARLFAVDLDPGWPPIAKRAAEEQLNGPPLGAITASAEALPFADESFDLVTCQTVLIHVRDVERVLSELLRVTHRGGRLLLVEPNNRIAALVLDSVSEVAAVDDIIAQAAFQLRCERGRAALGEGDISVGDRLPSLANQLNLDELAIFLGDRPEPVLPPYIAKADSARLDEIRRAEEADQWIWDREDAERYFVAGGGTTEAFEANWAALRARRQQAIAAAATHAYAAPGGSLTYIVTGRKPVGGQSAQDLR